MEQKQPTNNEETEDEIVKYFKRELTATAESEVEKISLDTAQLDMVPDNVLAQYVEEEMAASKKSETRKISPQAAASKIEKANPVKESKELKLNNELSKFFKKYKEMPGVETELADYFQHIQEYMSTNTSMKGNIIISGNSSSDKYDLAKAFDIKQVVKIPIDPAVAALCDEGKVEEIDAPYLDAFLERIR